ncbi:hypothetical protein Tco_1492992 [Tanacetum coccineum]
MDSLIDLVLSGFMCIYHLIGTIKVNLDLLLKEAKNPASLSLLVVDGDKPPKDKGQAFDHEGITRATEEDFKKEQWDRCKYVELNWILGCVSQDVFMGQVFSKNAKYGSALSEYYHKLNALWRQYDSLFNLHECICENSDKLKKHSQLLKLMQFLMGLDKIYTPIRSIILTIDPIPT